MPGREVEAFEAAFAAYCGAKRCVARSGEGPDAPRSRAIKSPKLGTQFLAKRIPIVDHHRIIEERRDCVILLAWHLSETIAKRVRQGVN
jgi:hypothetical protein